MSISDIKNYIQIFDRIASSGQPKKEQFKDIADAGYQLVINLAMPDSENAVADEENIITSLGMSYIHIPVPFDAPSAEHLKEFLNVMKTVSNQRIWIHCVLNYRVSAFLYQYQRLVHGLPDQEAKKVILKSWQPDKVWQEFMSLSREELSPVISNSTG